MSSRAELKLDWATHAAAKYAVEHWHYSKSLPTPPVVKVGVWEDSQFIGVVLFSRGSSDSLGNPYGLTCVECCELTRVALAKHKVEVSRIVAIAIKFLRKSNAGLRIIVSYADPAQRHIGGIYQAGNWVYTGKTAADNKFRSNDGRVWHSRQVSATGMKKQYGNMRSVPRIGDCVKIPIPGKHRYLMPLDDEMRRRILPLSKPYPKRAGSIDVDASGHQPEEGGSIPTSALHSQVSHV